MINEIFFIDKNDLFFFLFFSCAFVFWGFCLGFFPTAIIPREFNNISWFSLRGKQARSQCAMCHKQLSWRELIPIISYLKQKRKCACGQNAIPAFYPITEFIILCLTIAFFFKFGFSVLSIGLTLSLPFFATCFWMGCNARQATDRMLIVLAYIAVGTILFAIPDVNLFYAIYGAMGAGCVGAVIKIMGDKFSANDFLSWDVVKLWAVIGFWLGVSSVGYFLFLMGVGGALWILFPPKILKNKLSAFPYICWSLLVFFVLMLWL